MDKENNELSKTRMLNLLKHITREERNELGMKMIMWKFYGKGSLKEVLDYIKKLEDNAKPRGE